MKNMIISEKTKEKEELLEGIIDISKSANVALALNSVNLAKRYKWAINNIDLDTAKKLRLAGIKKYKSCVD